MITSGVILLNIPIMIVYFWFVIILLGTMRITLTNKMDNDITDISLVGCENKRIKKLKAGQSKTVWISIKKECSIYVEYVTKGMRKGEIVYDYVTPGMGQLVEHELDGENRRIVL